MRWVFVSIVAAALVGSPSCSSPCGTYADAEVRCEGYPSNEKRIIDAMCQASNIEEDNVFAKGILADMECAKKHAKNCDAYLKCKAGNDQR